MDYKPRWRKYLVAVYVIRILLCFVQNNFFPYAVLNLFMANLMLFVITLFYEATITKRIAVVGIVSMCEMAAEWIAVVILTIGDNKFKLQVTGYNGDAFTFVIIAVSLWVMSEIIHSFQNIHKESPVPRLFGVSIIAISAIMLILQSLMFIRSSMKELLIQMISAVCTLMVLFLIVYLYDSLSRNYMERIQAEIIEREKSYYYKQAQLLQKNSQALSDFRHDSMNHLYVLRSMLSDSDIEAKCYMEKLIGKMQDVSVYSSTGNVAVDSVINYKLSEAERKDIEVTSQIFLPSQLDVETEDMVGILGNLLDNAIEAVEKVDKKRYVDINMNYKAGTLFLRVKNSYDGILSVQNGEIATRKQNTKLHGIGLKSIRSTVESHDGTMDIEYTEQEFLVKIMLYI